MHARDNVFGRLGKAEWRVTNDVLLLLVHAAMRNQMDNRTAANTIRARDRVAAIREDISTRLWRVNQGMSSASFNELMDEMALLQFRCERRIVEGSVAVDSPRD